MVKWDRIDTFESPYSHSTIKFTNSVLVLYSSTYFKGPNPVTRVQIYVISPPCRSSVFPWRNPADHLRGWYGLRRRNQSKGNQNRIKRYFPRQSSSSADSTLIPQEWAKWWWWVFVIPVQHFDQSSDLSLCCYTLYNVASFRPVLCNISTITSTVPFIPFCPFVPCSSWTDHILVNWILKNCLHSPTFRLFT